MTLKVFLVEDSPVIRENLVAAIEEMAPVHVVGFADNASDATAWIEAHPEDVDLVVIDIFLRRGSGLDVLRDAATLTAARLVVLSNYATPEMRRKCLELRADKVFDKSSEIDALVEYCALLHDG